MEKTIAEIHQLDEDKNKVRPLTLEELREAETDIATILPIDVYKTFMGTIQDELGYMQIGEPEIRASHLVITSVNGEMIYKKPDGTDNRRDFIRGREMDEKIHIVVKYNRVQVRVKVGLEQEFTDTLFFNYALDRMKCQFAHGKTLEVADTMAILREADVFRSTPKDIGPSVEGLAEHLKDFDAHAQTQAALLRNLGRMRLLRDDVNAIIVDHHYRSALVSHKMRKGTRQVVDDNTLKAAHWLMYHSVHPYALPEEAGGEGMTAYDLFCCFVEGLKENDKDLVATLDKHLNLYRYFEEYGHEHYS